MQYFVVLGKNGKIAKSLYKGLSLNTNKLIALNWKLINKVLSENLNLEKIICSKLNIKENYCEFKVINCLKENTLKRNYKNTHLKLLEAFKGFKNKVSYLFLSTYEANKFPLTKYRKVKNLLESVIKDNGGFVIRIGYFLDESDLEIMKFNNDKTIITSMKNRIILVPVTVENDLIELINKDLNYKSQDKITSCYSKFCSFSISIKYPFIRFFDLKKENFYSLYIPLKLLSKFLLFLSYIFRRIGIFNNLSDLLEKPYSLHLFQRIIYSDEI